MKNKYSAGANFERRLVKHFLDAGASWAARTAGSHSAVDVSATLDNCDVYCQCQLDKHFSAGKIEAIKSVINGKPWREGYLVWRGGKHDNYKIVFKEVNCGSQRYGNE